jgi:hypothetical protein
MPRYVILDHDHPHQHWDFMLEDGTVLRTWRLATLPHDGGSTPATPLGNHRLLYLDYEGPVSGNRGRVVRWDAGTFTWLRDDRDHIEIYLEGTQLRGRVLLQHDAAEAWQLTYFP